MAASIINFINSINPDIGELRVDNLNKILQTRGATRVTEPIELVGLVHGLDRKLRVMRSFDSIGIEDVPVFNGISKMLSFQAGPNTSSLPTNPDSEYTKLLRN